MDMKIMLTFDENQTKFIRESQRKMNANLPEGKKVTEIDVVHRLLMEGHAPFSNYINRLPIKTVKHLKVFK